ncbi:MAG: hypothetical protein LBL47_03245 [Lactobacillus sp.]|jgi:hypothetical protein|nr:hypothetical protein [Lactobacillus sp.]
MTTNKPHSFDNLIAQFVYQGRFREENVAIKHVWQKGNGVFFDLYFYRTQTTKLIDTSYIRTIYDLSTDIGYTNIKKFVEEYFKKIEQPEAPVPDDFEPTQEHETAIEAYLEDMNAEIIILKFISGCAAYFEEVKLNSITEFVYKKYGNLDFDYIKSYIESRCFSEADFYDALELLKRKNASDLVSLMKEAVKVAIADGGLSYDERIYLAELIQTAREHNIKFDL